MESSLFLADPLTGDEPFISPLSLNPALALFGRSKITSKKRGFMESKREEPWGLLPFVSDVGPRAAVTGRRRGRTSPGPRWRR